jgi:hypothetical protein
MNSKEEAIKIALLCVTMAAIYVFSFIQSLRIDWLVKQVELLKKDQMDR